MDDKKRGLYGKFNVERADGSAKHNDCDYFVLDLTHAPFSLVALGAYADACEGEYPVLSADLRAKLNPAKSCPAESRRFQP
jgi:hypothetical protein